MSTGERRRWWAIAGLIALWLVTIVEALGMGVAGFSKFQNPDFWRASFSGWGYPEGFSAVVGAVEMAGALLLLLPASARYGASVLIVIMLGAMYTDLANESGLGLAAPLIHLTLLGIILAARRRRGGFVSSAEAHTQGAAPPEPTETPR